MSIKLQLAKAATIAAALAATVAFGPQSAAAQERPVTIYGEALNARTELVSFARFDLTSASDQRRLNSRVGAAIERVCLRDVGRDGLQDRGYYACEKQSWNDAAPQIAKAISNAGNLALSGGSPIAVTAIRVSAR